MTDGATHWPALADAVRRYVRRRVADPHMAEDLTQDVFVKLAQHLRGGGTTGPLPAWLLRVARTTIIDHYRTRPRTNGTACIPRSGWTSAPRRPLRSRYRLRPR